MYDVVRRQAGPRFVALGISTAKAPLGTFTAVTWCMLTLCYSRVQGQGRFLTWSDSFHCKTGNTAERGCSLHIMHMAWLSQKTLQTRIPTSIQMMQYNSLADALPCPRLVGSHSHPLAHDR